MRRIQRDTAKEIKEREEREEKRREREREERREQFNQMLQLQMLKTLAPTPAIPPKTATCSDSSPDVTMQDLSSGLQQLKEINLKMKDKQEDSDSYPVKAFVETFDQLVSKLREFCGLEQNKQLRVILYRLNRILDLTLLESGKTYLVECKEKEDYARVYLD